MIGLAVAEAVRESIDLNASIDEVWELLMDPRRLGEWVSAHRKLEEDPELPLQEGSRFKQKLGIGPISFRVEWEILEVETPNRARWLGKGPAGTSADVTYELSEIEEGTRFVYINEYKLPGGLAGRAAKGAFSSAVGSREARRSLKAFQKVLGG